VALGVQSVIIEEFLTDRSRHRVSRSVELDPLREQGALEGSALLDVRDLGERPRR
jgi:hypothetical protein